MGHQYMHQYSTDEKHEKKDTVAFRDHRPGE